MMRDIFRRGVRMVHKFGETERVSDPYGSRTFDPPTPIFPQQRSAPITSKQYGEHDPFDPPKSPIEKFRGGLASQAGPAPDIPGAIAAPIPSGTKKRHHR